MKNASEKWKKFKKIFAGFFSSIAVRRD